MQIRVYYEDTDIGGIVYHSNYLNFCERARSEVFFARGINPGSMSDGFVVRKVEAEFLGSATLGDMLEVCTKVLEQKRSTIWLLQEIFKDDMKLFSAKVLLVYINNGKIKKIPQHYEEVFADFKLQG
jgi:acyl-CoA thioester hydrolase